MADEQALPTSIAVKIFAPFKTYYESQAKSVSAVNATGPFDILPGHKNFITLLRACTIKVRQEGKEDFNLDIERAVMHVKADKVVVFLDV